MSERLKPCPEAMAEMERLTWQPHAFEYDGWDAGRCARWFKWLGGDVRCGMPENHEIHKSQPDSGASH